ncbi:MAG: signal peptidase I [Candidatus Woesearchaeota archaeon]
MSKKNNEKEKKLKPKSTFGKIWYFIWEDNSLLSWIVNIILAFVLIKFIVYPVIGFVLGTGFPVVAVISGSMEHKAVHPCIDSDCSIRDTSTYRICDEYFDEKPKTNFEFFWNSCGDFYENLGIVKEEFKNFHFKNGFNTGDIIVIRGIKPENIEIGNVIVFAASKDYPIIHRVVDIDFKDGVYYYTTKGDHNPEIDPILDTNIHQDNVIGKAFFKIPYLGWIKIGFVNFLEYIGLFKLVNFIN